MFKGTSKRRVTRPIVSPTECDELFEARIVVLGSHYVVWQDWEETARSTSPTWTSTKLKKDDAIRSTHSNPV